MGTKGPVGEWLEQKYLEWMQAEGGYRKQHEFAEYLGIDRILINQYLNGKKRPSPESARQIAEKLGPEIYSLLEIANPDPRVKKINAILNELDDDELAKLLDDAEKLLREKRTRVGNEVATGNA